MAGCCWTGKTELAKQVAKYLHKDSKKVNENLFTVTVNRCASDCAVKFRICNWEVGGSNLGQGYFAPRSTQPSVHPGLVNECQL